MDSLQVHYGLSQASIIEMLLRDDARRHGIIFPGSGAAKAIAEGREPAQPLKRTAEK